MEQPPKSAIVDAAGAASLAAVPTAPGTDGPAAGFMEKILAVSTEARREKWIHQIAEVVMELQKRIEDFSLEKLSRNDLFVTVTLEAAQIACRNHHEEKLKALKHAVLHAALPNGPGEQLQFMFLRFIDEMTPVHLAILAILDNPLGWMEQHGVANPKWTAGSVSALIQYCVPPLRGQPEVSEQLVRDLQARGLLDSGQFLRTPTSEAGMMQSRTTVIGRAFLGYISED